jgi:hypothetical protein
MDGSMQEQPRAVLGMPTAVWRPAAIVAGALLVPLVVAFLAAGSGAALAVALGFAAGLAPAQMLPTRFGLALAIPAALTGAVATSVHGDAFAAACFAALACLLIAPANTHANGLLAGLPTAAAVLAAVPGAPTAPLTAGWMLLGGVSIVLVGGWLLRAPAPADPVDSWTAWVHAGVMAVSVGIVVGVLNVVDVPHGYWIAATLTIVLRPFRGETTATARERILGTVAGAVLALAIALLVPGWAALALCLVMLVLVAANALLGRSGRVVLFLTPLLVLVGSGDTVGTALDRVLTTVAGALLAALLALVVARLSRQHRTPEVVPLAG